MGEQRQGDELARAAGDEGGEGVGGGAGVGDAGEGGGEG